ncbi:Rho GTPase activation protein [Globomyces pollinis-pini]|nr:Rho GTPase activation protein [Globomyces pollinis-pini]
MNRTDKEVLTTAERNLLTPYLLKLTPEGLKDLQTNSRPFIHQLPINETKIIDLDVDRYHLIFSHQKSTCQALDVVLRLRSTPSTFQSTSFKFHIPPSDGNFHLSVTPPVGQLTFRNPALELQFKLEFSDTIPILVNCVVVMELQGGYRHYFVVKSRLKPSQKPMPLIPHAIGNDTIFEGCSFRVPKPLIRLRNMLVYSNGFVAPGIFRQTGVSWEVQSLNTHLSHGTYYSCLDPHVIATCIKMHLRSEDSPFLRIPKPVLMGTKSSADSYKDLLLSFPQSSPDLEFILWVLDLMVCVVMNQAENGMNIRSIAIAIAPNVFEIVDQQQLATSLPIMVAFLGKLVAHRQTLVQRA